MRRYLLAAAFAGTLVAGFGASSNAAPVLGPDQASHQSPIIQVDRRCGPRAHYVPAHRVRHHLVRGACIRNHR